MFWDGMDTEFTVEKNVINKMSTRFTNKNTDDTDGKSKAKL